MKLQLMISIALFGFALSSQATFKKYSEWKSQPQEKFSSAEDSFKSAMDKLLEQYVDKGLTKEDLYRAATAGMLESLNDEHSWNTLLSPHELQDLQSDLSGKVSGIGIGLKFDDATGYGQILDIVAQSPADKAGLKRDDEILSVNGEKFKGKQFADLVAAIRGKIGDSVALKVLREDKLLSLKLKREAIPWTPVEFGKVDNSTALLSIGYFTADTPKLAEDKIAAINAPEVKNLIIDLRNNAGGGFEQAIKTAELFVPQGKTIVATKNRDGKMQTYSSKRGVLRKGINVIVITNSKTSSGAEFFAGAIRDDLGAKIIGEKTFGKWNVQMIDSLPNGFAIKYTTQAFETPRGLSYQNVGLKPDVEVTLPKDVDSAALAMKYDIAKRLETDTQLKAAVELVKAM